jgi:hypothetical protein
VPVNNYNTTRRSRYVQKEGKGCSPTSSQSLNFPPSWFVFSARSSSVVSLGAWSALPDWADVMLLASRYSRSGQRQSTPQMNPTWNTQCNNSKLRGKHSDTTNVRVMMIVVSLKTCILMMTSVFVIGVVLLTADIPHLVIVNITIVRHLAQTTAAHANPHSQRPSDPQRWHCIQKEKVKDCMSSIVETSRRRYVSAKSHPTFATSKIVVEGDVVNGRGLDGRNV